ncbi:MAG: nuclear transport factor 2 family protein [Myxococcales bacterium]|nr:nuclear transport factor 2 family protein [Myxococcales bacterium]
MSEQDAPQPRNALTRAYMGIDGGLPLEVSQGGIDELRADLQRMMDIEAIKQLKHAYFRCIDTANFEELATLFHDDVSVHFIGGGYEWKLQGKAEYVESVTKSFHRESVGHHNGHHPEIQIRSASEATGVWYLTDNMWLFDTKFFTTGTALYWDRYVKVDGRWTIKDTKYERIYEINRPLADEPPFSSHYLATHGTDLSA